MEGLNGHFCHGFYPQVRPKSLKKLISVLDDARNDIYLLIDRKSRNAPAPAEFSTSFSKLVPVSRIPIYWGDYSQVQAELNLLKAAAPQHYAYYHLLSGLDLPLADQDTIHDFFDAHPGMEFITYSAMGNAKDLRRRVSPHINRKSYRSRKLQDRILMKAQKSLFDLFPFYEKEIPLDRIGYGSNWFSIDDDLAQTIVNEEDRIFKVFGKGYLVDELLVQTAVNMHPEFRDKVYCSKPVHDRPEELQGNLRYINWWDGRPYTWRAGDLDRLKAAREAGHLFSRKFDERVDGKIIELVITQMIGKNI